MSPHRSWKWSLPPRGRKNNDSIVNFAKCKDFASLSMLVKNVALPYGKMPHENIERPMTKNGYQKFWEIDEISLGNAEFFLETA